MMPKKLTEVASESGELQLAVKVRESANQIWLAGLGAFSKAQKEGVKMFEALVAEGEKVQEPTKTEAAALLAEGKARVTGAWDKLEQVFEERMARALQRLNLPNREDIDVLSQRVAELTEIAKKLSHEMEGEEHGARSRMHRAKAAE
jgi:poly(hydroxyalkanoate) granule-associated protein